MKFKYAIYISVITGLLLPFLFSCKKEAIKVVPTITIAAVTNITASTATSGGNITYDSGPAITARGVCWSRSQRPTIADSKTIDGTGSGSFTSSITGLTSGTTYYLRTYATNSNGTVYGSILSFTTLNSGIIFNPILTYGTVTDIDGNVYKTITIGTQTWMVENLRTTKYSNGDPIPNVTDSTAWSNLITGAYCNYNNDVNFSTIHGSLYNWYAVNDSRNIAPTGWHVPSDAEWTTLTTYLGGVSVAGGKLKEAGTTHWLSPNTGATNETGFTALPCGNRSFVGKFDAVGYDGLWWSSTLNADPTIFNAYYRFVYYSGSDVNSPGANESSGFSVRCVMN
jgi:uncharacterized protein (TIGR02145 family)